MQPLTATGYPLSIFYESEKAARYLCPICRSVCRDVVELNCCNAHCFCKSCILRPEYCQDVSQLVSYTPNNIDAINHGILSVNDDENKMNTITMIQKIITCPIDNTSGCNIAASPLTLQTILQFKVYCYNHKSSHPSSCQWIGELNQLDIHFNQCMNNITQCPFGVIGCNVQNILTTNDLEIHLLDYQMIHLNLQIDNINKLNNKYELMQNTIKSLNKQQIELKEMMIEIEKQKKNNIKQANDDNKQANNQLMQLNFYNQNKDNLISINNNNDNKNEYHRWKYNPIYQTLQSISNEIIQSNINKSYVAPNLKYSVSDFNSLFADINDNKLNNFTRNINKKLVFIQGSVINNKNKLNKYNRVIGIDLHNKVSMNLLNDPIVNYSSWDCAFCGLTVINNINSKYILNYISSDNEQMLFKLKHGYNINNNAIDNNNNNNKRNIFLKNECNQIINSNPNDKIYSKNCSILLRCGGHIVSSSTATNRVDGVCLNTGDMLSSFPNLNTPRYGCNVVYSKSNGIICCGGKNDIKTLKSVEQLDIFNNNSNNNHKWNYLASMNEDRYSPSACIYPIDNNNNECIFIGGGWNKNKQDLKSAEIYSFDNSNSSWLNISSMNDARHASGCCYWKWKDSGNIIIGGGWRTPHSVEEYNIRKDKWFRMPNTLKPHKSNPQLWVDKDFGNMFTSFNGILCIAGNIWENNNKNIKNIKNISGYIEYYDPRDWKQGWFLSEDLTNILNDHVYGRIRGFVPF